MTQDEAKRMAARRALEFVEDGMLLGLGSGTTSAMFIEELGERVQAIVERYPLYEHLNAPTAA